MTFFVAERILIHVVRHRKVHLGHRLVVALRARASDHRARSPGDHFSEPEKVDRQRNFRVLPQQVPHSQRSHDSRRSRGSDQTLGSTPQSQPTRGGGILGAGGPRTKRVERRSATHDGQTRVAQLRPGQLHRRSVHRDLPDLEDHGLGIVTVARQLPGQ